MTLQIYYRFNSCCAGFSPTIAANTLSQAGISVPSVPGVYIVGGTNVSNGTQNVLEANQCYRIEVLPPSPTPVPDLVSWPAAATLTQVLPAITDCPDPNVPGTPCPCTIQQNLNFKLYRMVPCCGGPPIPIYFNNESIAPGVYLYTGPVVSSAGLVHGCYTLAPDTNTIVPPGGGPPAGHVLVANADFDYIDPDFGCNDQQCLDYCAKCICTRVRYTGIVDPLGPLTEPMNYTDCAQAAQVYDIPLDGSWGPKTCMLNYTLPAGDFEVETFGDCVPVDTTGTEFECPPCYVLYDCNDVEDPIYTLNPSIQQYIDLNQIIQIEGSNTCWRPEISDTDCDCAINVNVTYVYSTCPSCLNPKGYKLTECTTKEVIYTNQDLSQYVGQTVEIDCGGCWIVEELDLPAPSTQPVNIITVFDDCKACNGEYFLIEDCAGKVDSIITSTDLSAYVGKVIKLKYCPETCWTVSTTTLSADAGEVLVDTEYVDCPECFLTFQCECNRITNTTAEPLGYSYYDCDGVLQSITVNPGLSSPKICALVILSSFTPNDCDCIQVTTDIASETGSILINYPANNTGNLVNGQPTYVFTFDDGAIGLIVWEGTAPNQIPNSWVLYIDGVLQKIYLTVADPDVPGCPLGQWTNSTGIFSTQLCPPTPEPFAGQIEVFGNCIDNQCPRPEFPKRKVKPGYNSPVCSEDKYEKIVCNFSEWMYKDVLEQRYGISNCCPDELIKWEIKKEILDLEIMINPDYVCQPVYSCCTVVPNVPTGSCNSQ